MLLYVAEDGGSVRLVVNNIHEVLKMCSTSLYKATECVCRQNTSTKVAIETFVPVQIITY